MNTWELIFIQSRANDGWYSEAALPTHVWAWPEQTWLKKRLRELRCEEKEREGWPIRGHSERAGSGEAHTPTHDDARDHFSLMPLLLGEDVPAEVRRALNEGRSREAAGMSMDRYKLDRADAGALTDIAAA
ncbi:MAG TPA: hypothetical protein VKH64_08935 [Candidatus Binatia bacterium]|nr:hypothetical protein [Candidatus Binatia bacterium]